MSDAQSQQGQGESPAHAASEHTQMQQQKQQQQAQQLLQHQGMRQTGSLLGRRTSSLGGSGAGYNSLLRRTSTISSSGALNSTSSAHVEGLPPIRRTSTLVLPPVTGLPQQQQQQVVVKVQRVSGGRGTQAGAWSLGARKTSSFGGYAPPAGATQRGVEVSNSQEEKVDEGEGGWVRRLTKADVRRLTAIVPGGPAVPRVSEVSAAARPFPGGMLSASGYNGGMEGIWS